MHSLWQDDEGLFSLCRTELFSAVVGDVMDQMGLQRQFLPPAIRPLDPAMVAIGRAMPVLEADVVGLGHHNGALKQPFGLMLQALDDLKRNEVYLCAGASPSYALWGELMSLRAKMLGAAAAVVAGYCRDTHGILALGFPTFSFGPFAQDQAPRGKVVDFRTSIRIGDVMVETGDVVFGDIDGVCVVPQAAEEEVFRKALEKARGEKRVRAALEGGMSACESFRTFGIM